MQTGERVYAPVYVTGWITYDETTRFAQVTDDPEPDLGTATMDVLERDLLPWHELLPVVARWLAAPRALDAGAAWSPTWMAALAAALASDTAVAAWDDAIALLAELCAGPGEVA